MSTFTTFILLLLLAIIVSNNINNVTSNQDVLINNKVVRVLSAMKWAKGTLKGQLLLSKEAEDQSYNECVKLYEDTEPRLARLVVFGGDNHKYNYSHDDAITWLCAALASHRSCLDGLKEKSLATFIVSRNEETQNLTLLLKDALFHYRQLSTHTRTGEFHFFIFILITLR